MKGTPTNKKRALIVGSGIGSVSGYDFRKEVPNIAKAVSEGAFDVRTQTIPLSDVATAWTTAACFSRYMRENSGIAGCRPKKLSSMVAAFAPLEVSAIEPCRPA